jgi:hypothetical protein
VTRDLGFSGPEGLPNSVVFYDTREGYGGPILTWILTGLWDLWLFVI